jgi:catechol 2,3-dioxygenase-like lactoylglutathione lyase family enzyme
MPHSTLPPRASLEFLRKLAKDRLADLRRIDPHAQLAAALLAVAQDYGFTSWRALKAEIDRRDGTHAARRLFLACAEGDLDAVTALLRKDPSLVHAREDRHDTTPLYAAARCGNLDVVRALLDAGADVQGAADSEGLGVIGWITFYPPASGIPMDVLSLLLERGARHDIFSAIAVGHTDLIRTVVEQDPSTLDQRLTRRWHGQTALHFAIARERIDLLDLLIDLGADVDATDANGQTALAFAKLRGDGTSASRLVAAGARPPAATAEPKPESGLGDMAASILGAVPVIASRDVAGTLAWYTSLGFTEVARYPADEAVTFWGMVSLGTVELTFDVRETTGSGTLLVTVSDGIEEMFDFLTSRQLGTADVEFIQTLHQPVHGGREFSIRDPNGYTLRFLQQQG